MFTRSQAPLLALFSTLALAFATGCAVAEGPEADDAAPEEVEEVEVGEASSALISVDFHKGCNSQGKIWEAKTGKCLTMYEACTKQGKYFDGNAWKCVPYGSREHMEALCGTHGMVYAGPGNMGFSYPGGEVRIQCVPRPSNGPIVQPNQDTGERLNWCVGLGCPKPANNNPYGMMHCTNNPFAPGCNGR